MITFSLRRLLSAGFISIALVGCSAASDVSNTSMISESADTTLPSGEAGEKNEFVYSLVGGGTIDLSRGDNAEPVALWFWAPG